MDVIKTSLIIAIGITLYYLLLQWPVGSPGNDKAYSEDKRPNTISDSESLLSQPLEPLSSLGESKDEVMSEERGYYEIKNENLSLYLDPVTGRFELSQLNKISKTKDSEEPFVVLGPTYDEGLNRENIYFANSGFYTRSQGYLNPEFSKISQERMDGGGTVYTLEGSSKGMSFIRKIDMPVTGYKIIVEDVVLSLIHI